LESNAGTAFSLTAYDPGEPKWAVERAFASCQLGDIELAKMILRDALERHPREAVLHFKLAVYECKSGNIAEAKWGISEACRLGTVWKQRALDDPDLAPLWEQ
jgi:hypothetical protein